MPQIGAFTRTQSGYFGHVRTLSLDLELTLVAAEPTDTENAPDYRVHLRDEDGPEVGAGWKRTGERAGDYIAVLLDDPIFVQPIRAHLFQAGDDKTAWALHWSRPPRRSERG